MSNLGFLFAGFTVAWGLVFGYVWVLARRSASLEARLAGLESRQKANASGD
jgi:CcmD family protein